MPEWPMAIILLMFCRLSSSTAFLTDSTSFRNLILGPGPGLDNQHWRKSEFFSSKCMWKHKQKTCVRGHLSRDRNSYVYQHLQQSQVCRCLANKNCFSIVDCAPNKLLLMLKEATHIKWENPTLNKQLKHADLTLSFWYYSLSLFFIYMYIYIFVLITFCVITIVIFTIFTIFFLVLSVVLAQVLFHVSRILKLYVNFFEILNCITF